MSSLRLDWCSYDAAKYAVRNWHYSRTMPAGKRVQIGVWENGKFIGAVIFGTGAAPQAACPYRIGRMQICELVRVAITEHETPITRILSIAIKMLKAHCPKLRLIVSYADPEQGHHGGIYSGGNWVYTGPTAMCEQFEWTSTGKRVHTKTIRTGRRGYATKLLENGTIRSVKVWKHKYLMPLDAMMAQQVLPLSKPYPKRVRSVDGDTPAAHAGESGSTPTRTLSKTLEKQ